MEDCLRKEEPHSPIKGMEDRESNACWARRLLVPRFDSVDTGESFSCEGVSPGGSGESTCEEKCDCLRALTGGRWFRGFRLSTTSWLWVMGVAFLSSPSCVFSSSGAGTAGVDRGLGAV